MQLILDSNEFIFAYGSQSKPSCQLLLEKIIAHRDTFKLRVSRTIAEEVRRNTVPERFKEFWSLLQLLGTSINEDWEVPFELGAKYETLRLKRGDAFIAAYTEWTGSQYLITENRDFRSLSHLPFKVFRAEEFLKNIK